jgi:hypothetical protein
MAIFIPTETSKTLTLKQFVQEVQYLYTGQEQFDEPTLQHLAQLLQQLANNKQLLPQLVADEILDRTDTLDVGNQYGNDAMVLYVNQQPFFQVRICFWSPPSGLKKPDEIFDVYQSAHDHNFAFLTTNYYGPGYISKFYQYKYVEGLAEGDKVPLSHLTDHQLTPGQVVFYEPSKDVHLQIAPTAFSVTLNLMFALNNHQQFVFDLKNQLVQQVVLSSNQTAAQFVEEICALL